MSFFKKLGERVTGGAKRLGERVFDEGKKLGERVVKEVAKVAEPVISTLVEQVDEAVDTAIQDLPAPLQGPATAIYEQVKGLTKLESGVEVKQEDRIYGKVMFESYNSPANRPKEIDGYKLDEDLSTEREAIYANENAKTVIIGFRGTVISDLRDIISDANIVLGSEERNERFKKSLDKYEEVEEKYPNYKIGVTGHSLGSLIAVLTGEKMGADKIVVFNGAFGTNPRMTQLLKDSRACKGWARKTTNYRILFDPVSILSLYGCNTRTFKVPTERNPLNYHTKDQFKKAIYG
jgi:hypothetical protein